MRIHLDVVWVTIALVAAATGCGSYSSPSDSGNTSGADSTRDTTSPPPSSPYLHR